MIPPTALAFALLKITGLTNLLFFVLIFLSCRCLGNGPLLNRLSQYAWYKNFYRFHCYYWWLLFFSVLLHTLLATYLFGLGF
jgi:hypothetical protein